MVSNMSVNKSSLMRLYLVLAIAMMLYKASQMMFKTTINQYIYLKTFQSEKKTRFTSMTSTDNNSRIPNICYPNHTIKEDLDFAQEIADKYQTVLLSVASTLSFLTLILYGSMSDYVGRKFILIVCVSAYVLQTFITLVVVHFNASHWYFFFAYIVDGIGGSAFGFSLGCFLCVADATDDKKNRVLGIALIESLTGLGSITTKFSTSYFVKRYGFQDPILTSSVLCVCVLFIVVFILDETTTNSKKILVSKACCDCFCKRLPSCKTLFRNLTSFYFGKTFKTKRKTFWICFLVFCLVESPMILRSDLLPLLQVGWPFCWTTSKANTYSFVGLGLNYIVAMVLMKLFQSCVTDLKIAVIGILSAIAFNMMTGLAQNALHLYIGLVAGTFMILPKAIIRGIASNTAGTETQGSLFAGLIASELICEVASEIIYQFVYVHKHGPIDGTIFIVIASFLPIALLLIFFLKTPRRSEESVSVHQNGDRCSVIIGDAGETSYS